MSCGVMDVYQQESSCSVKSARFETVLSEKDIKVVTNVMIFHVILLMSFPCQWGRKSFYEPFRIGENMEQKHGSRAKMSGIVVRNVEADYSEAPGSVSTVNCQWMWIDLICIEVGAQPNIK